MAKLQPSKLATTVRFRSPAPLSVDRIKLQKNKTLPVFSNLQRKVHPNPYRFCDPTSSLFFDDFQTSKLFYGYSVGGVDRGGVYSILEGQYYHFPSTPGKFSFYDFCSVVLAFIAGLRVVVFTTVPFFGRLLNGFAFNTRSPAAFLWLGLGHSCADCPGDWNLSGS